MRKTAVIMLFSAAAATAQDWNTVQRVRHDTYQAVKGDGSSDYRGGFPLRLRGVVLNNPEDWLDPTPNFNTIPWDLGGEWEIFVQAYDDPNETYDDGDFGGTACWMGQNYGNLGWINDPNFSYSNEEWLAELERLDYPHGRGQPRLRAGDWVEIRARAGLPYAGKMNVNEQHSKDPNRDFEIFVLRFGFGLPSPAPIVLSDLKDANDAFLWDPTRRTGGERYQSTRVVLKGVKLVDGQGWGPDKDFDLVDATGRTLRLHVGRHPSFASIPAPTAPFNVVGILDQASQQGIGGYYVIVLHANDLVCGDANCDGAVNFADINPFVLALQNPQEYARRYPGCNADLTGDFQVDFADIEPFVRAMGAMGRCP